MLKETKYTDQIRFTDDFVFYSVMSRNKDICKKIVELCIDKKVRDIRYLSGQETEKISPSGKGIRMDVYLEDADQTLYNVEMQTSKSAFLGKRTRYYDSVMSIHTLQSGQSYQALPDTYVIFLCTFDPFGEHRALYRFSSREESNPGLSLDDGSYKVFLNAYGDENGCPKALQELMAAIRGETVSGDGLDRKIADAVDSLAVDAQWRYDYMLYEINLSESREAGLAEGREEGRLEGKRKTILEDVCKISRNMSMSYEEAMDVLDLADSERIWLRAELSAAGNHTDDAGAVDCSE